MNRYQCVECDYDCCQSCFENKAAMQNSVPLLAPPPENGSALVSAQPLPPGVELSDVDFQLLQVKMPKAGLEMSAMTHLAQVREERRQVEALWEKVAGGRLGNQQEWARLEAYRNGVLAAETQAGGNGTNGTPMPMEASAAPVSDFGASNNQMERMMLDSQRARLKRERDELQEDLKVVRGVQKECIAMWEEAEKHLLKVKLTAEMGRR